jgi:hypothetical protein
MINKWFGFQYLLPVSEKKYSGKTKYFLNCLSGLVVKASSSQHRYNSLNPVSTSNLNFGKLELVINNLHLNKLKRSKTLSKTC